ncbi:MAG: bifunctional acetate--CoA ligase family protein/GNAT family N-acetyltransferase [Candidatus Bathyarchaeota archaeon]|nr:MAG: bifunctional acetate--CoA ligase family protein/GNAT family N-acetyltransferase [Candidatus Bathyarchaeota archaeon]
MGIENLNRVFNPKRIAVIGASERKGSIGAKIFRNLIGVGYKGEVFPVNPFRQTVQGIPAFPSISKIPLKVDLAVIATPAHTVPQIVEECGKAGVSGIIIISAGFKEIAEDGAELERQILEHQKKYHMRIIGPNSFGVMRPQKNLYATFADKQVNPGKIAFISQSAALCASALDWAEEAQIGFSAVVSTGSMIDVDLGDFIDYFGTDPQTRSIVLYVESIKKGRKFMSAARGFARAKPIVLIKAGRFKESCEAILCHSGSLGGEDAVYDAAFKRAGIVRVEAISDLFNCAEALAMQPNPAGSNLIVITNAGGPGIMATDRLIARGGRLSQLSNETVQALKSVLPSYCSMANPVDIYEDATPTRFRNVMEICLKDPNSDGFLIIYTPQGATNPIALAKIVVDLAKQIKKPVLVSLMSEDNRCRKARRLLQRKGIPSFTAPEEAVSTFMYMYNYTQNLELLYQTPEELPVEQVNGNFLKGILRRAFCEGRKVLSLPESIRFLEEYKIPTVKTLVARTPKEAVVLSSKLGYPVVMKALSTQISHKSKIKGVILNVCSRSETTTFFKEIAKRVRNYSSIAEFQGVTIQPMIREKGYELLIGSKKDSQFGSIIIFGMGGTATELFKDMSIGFPPLNQTLARWLIKETAIYKHAQSIGHPLNVKLLEEILVKFSQLVTDFPEIKELDINPLIVNENGAVAVDARIVIEWERMMREAAEYNDNPLIASYPQKYVATRKLKNETPVLLRPIKSEDEQRFNEFLKSLSAETMRLRFFAMIKEMSHETLTRYCNLDYDREIAIVAELGESSKSIIGAARLIIELGGKSGEFAVLVGDKWQGFGLGSKLMDLLVDIAKDMHVNKIYGYVSANNYKMLNMCNKKGFKVKTLDEDTVTASLLLS